MSEVKGQLKALKKREFQLNELVEQAARLTPLFVEKQVRYKVSDLPNERTIRYYLQETLIDRPVRRGRRPVFGYRHLLQMLLIKRLQSRYLPLKKIRVVIDGLSNRELEKLLTAASEEMKLLAFRTSNIKSSPIQHAPRGDVSSVEGCTSWRKFEIDEGMELHVEERYRLDSSPGLDAITARITQVLSLLSSVQTGTVASTGGAIVARRPLRGYPSGKATTRFAGAPASLSTLAELANGFPAASPSESIAACPPALDDAYAWCPPAPPVSRLSNAVVALITEGGLVPRGNPDGLESARSSRFLKYSIAGMKGFERDVFESVDLGWDTTHVNADPDRLLPLDVMRELEGRRVIGKTFDYFYTTTGVATTVDAARSIGRGIAAELKREGVSAAILTAT